MKIYVLIWKKHEYILSEAQKESFISDKIEKIISKFRELKEDWKVSNIELQIGITSVVSLNTITDLL